MISIFEIKAKILEQAMRGELVPQDEKDESATVLYQNIQKEKQELIKKKIIRKLKPLPLISEDEQPYELPKQWIWVRLGEVTNYGTSEKVENDEVPPATWVLELEDIEKDSSRLLKRVSHKERPFKSTKNRFDQGDVLYGKLRPYLNKVIVAEESGVCSTEIQPVSGKAFFPKFLKYAFKRKEFQDYINQKMYGAKMPRLGTEDARMAIFPMPPYNEQIRIVKKIETVSSLLEQVELKSRFQDENIKLTLQKILDDALKGELVSQNIEDQSVAEYLNQIQEEKEQLVKEKKIKKQPKLPDISEKEILFDIPGNWTWVRLGELTTKLGAGKTPLGGEKNYTEKGIPFIRSQNVRNEGLDLSNVAHIPEEIHATMQGSVVEQTDILLNITGGSIGRSCILPEDFITANVNQHVAIIRLVDPGIRYFIHACIVSPYFQNEIMRVQVGASREGLSMDKLSKILVPFPPIEEQKQIVTKIETIMNMLGDIEENRVK
ncbi:restriction endonuclease subunit S [Niallia circulans]|uniref:restriction endonuclease subunit S n=1 Tax=Niallia circulans TaxID=1397 RepID=UPI001F48312A|nr:restriction endonuclease subunit S [Niallia circulans]MCF2649685.1 restriction endonuclease subunit S [Niallia circulans]